MLSLQTNKSWESAYLVDLELQDTNSNCKQNYIQLDLGKWSGITEYTCLCYNNDNVFFTTNKKTICKHNSNDNRYKNTYICKELTKIAEKKRIPLSVILFDHDWHYRDVWDKKD